MRGLILYARLNRSAVVKGRAKIYASRLQSVICCRQRTDNTKIGSLWGTAISNLSPAQAVNNLKIYTEKYIKTAGELAQRRQVWNLSNRNEKQTKISHGKCSTLEVILELFPVIIKGELLVISVKIKVTLMPRPFYFRN